LVRTQLVVDLPSAYRGKRVFVTGHTGFKGAWLTEWLLSLGAKVTGYSLPPPTDPALFIQLGLAERIQHIEADIRDAERLARAVSDAQPEFVFHLAAQPLVRLSYAQPRETYEVNVIGTLNVLEALRPLKHECAAGFPTTVAPILQNGAVPVFLDNDPRTLNADLDRLEEAFTPGKTKAVMMAHTLGNAFDLERITAFCRQHDIWLVEDNCDALGTTYSMLGADPKPTGTFGDLSTQSFYPPHHLTLGEGGAVNVVRSMQFKVLVESFRDWGRDCWCASGKDNTCKKRFGWQLGELPEGYDHKFIYSHFGYNLKPLDIQAAIGLRQIEKLPHFIKARSDNWNYLRNGLNGLGEFFEFMLPTHATGWSSNGFTWDDSGHRTDCSWFGFMMRVRPEAPFKKPSLARYLDQNKIGNRMLFGGNLLRQPAFVQLRKERPEAIRIVGEMSGADRIMNESLFVGVYPGLTREMLDYIIETITAFCKQA
jgi:CDP-6-deoxy-D-xylo-4-hexulose-3-dehydrase